MNESVSTVKVTEKIELHIEGRVIEVTVTEAKRLQEELRAIFPDQCYYPPQPDINEPNIFHYQPQTPLKIYCVSRSIHEFRRKEDQRSEPKTNSRELGFNSQKREKEEKDKR